MASKEEINNEIKRKQDKVDIYTAAGKLDEVQRLSTEIENLLQQL